MESFFPAREQARNMVKHPFVRFQDGIFRDSVNQMVKNELVDQSMKKTSILRLLDDAIDEELFEAVRILYEAIMIIVGNETLTEKRMIIEHCLLLAEDRPEIRAYLTEQQARMG